MKIKEIKILSDKSFPSVRTILSDLKQSGITRADCLNYSIGQAFLNYLSSELGILAVDDVTNPNHEMPHVHEVKPATNKIDKHGFIPYSLTNKELPCHTEDYFNSKSSNIVLFYCVRPAKTGGETYLVHIDEIINKLEPFEITFLSKKKFPTPTGLTHILSYSESEKQYHIRYSRIIINKIATLEPKRVTQEMIIVLDKLDKLFSEHKTILQLPQNSCVILDNTRVLHGRSSFDENSDRLLFRVKLNSTQLWIP